MLVPPLLTRRRLLAAGAVVLAAGCARTEPITPPPPEPIPPFTGEPLLTQGLSIGLAAVRIGFLHQIEGQASLTAAFDGDDRFESTLRFAPPRTIPMGGGWWMVEQRDPTPNGRAQLGFVSIGRPIAAPPPEQRLLFVGGWARAVGLSRISLVEVDGGQATVERWTKPNPGPQDRGTRSTMRIGDVVQTAGFRYTVASIHAQRDWVVGHVAFTVEPAGE